MKVGNLYRFIGTDTIVFAERDWFVTVVGKLIAGDLFTLVETIEDSSEVRVVGNDFVGYTIIQHFEIEKAVC